MKKIIVFLIPLLFLLIYPMSASATPFLYTGNGYMDDVTTGISYNVSVNMVISDQLMEWDFSTGKYIGPVQVTPGVPLQSDYYGFNVYSWHVNIQQVGNFSGNTGMIGLFAGCDLLNGDCSTSGAAGWGLSGNSYSLGGGTWDDIVGGIINPARQLNDPLYGKLLPEYRLAGPGYFWSTDDPIFSNHILDYGIPIERRGAVPEPSSFMLMGSGLAGLAWFSLKRRKK